MKTAALLFAALPLAGLLAACGGDTQSGGTRVVASFYPYAYVAEQVGGTHIPRETAHSFRFTRPP